MRSMAQKRLTAVGRVPARRAQIFSNSGANFARCGGVAAQCAEGNAIGGGDADGGSAADDHGDDDVGDLLVVGGEDVALLERQLCLVDETVRLQRSM